MLIGLNRFLTTEEVRQEYHVPESLAPEFLASLPTVVVTQGGTRIHAESEVDAFVTEFCRRKRLADAEAEPLTHARAGRPVETLEIALYAEELRRRGRTWKEIFKACRERWPGDHRVQNPEQIRATHRRHLRKRSD